MSYKNDSHKGGTHTKGNQTTKGSHSSQASHGGNTSGKSFQAQDIKSLVHNQGRARLGGQEWALKAPSWNDSALQAIISDPKFTVKPSAKPATDGKWIYEIHGHGKTINVTIGH